MYLRHYYIRAIGRCLSHTRIVAAVFAAVLLGAAWLIQMIPSEYAPKEDRGNFFVMVNGPEGASYSYMERYMDEVEQRMMEYVEAGEVSRLMVRASRSFGNAETLIPVWSSLC